MMGDSIWREALHHFPPLAQAGADHHAIGCYPAHALLGLNTCRVKQSD